MSFEFFKSLFEEKISSFDPERPTWKGLRVYGCDGDQYEIPLSNDILDQGYRGYPCKNNKETYFPRMYVVHAYDVLSRVSKDIRYSPTNDEVHNSFEMASVFEKESVTLYDRLLFSKDMIRTHGMVGSYFVAKCKCGSTFNEVIEFFESKKRNSDFYIEGEKVLLIKKVNPKSGAIAVYATNLSRCKFTNKEIDELYALRWEVETSFRDLSHTLKIEQWHSKSLNGVLQELIGDRYFYKI